MGGTAAAACASVQPGCPSALCFLLQIEALLNGVLEGGHELSEEEMVLLFSGKPAGHALKALQAAALAARCLADV